MRRKQLSFSMEELTAKSKETRLENFLAGKDFEQYLGNKEWC